MFATHRAPSNERISELVALLSGAPMERTRVVVDDAHSRHVGEDRLVSIADALVSLGCSAPR